MTTEVGVGIAPKDTGRVGLPHLPDATRDNGPVTPGSRTDGTRTLAIALGVAAAVAAFVVAAWFARPFGVATVGSDSESSVLYFERIVNGEILERFLGTTPKPLLTVAYGLAYSITGDWRSVAWLGTLAFAAAIGCTTLLAARVAGPLAGAFAAVGLVANVSLMQDVALAYAMSWALLALAIAGLAATAARPRWAIVGVTLAVAALARQEAVLVTGAAALLLAGGWARARAGRGAAPPRGAWLVLLGLAAIVVIGAHDWLLTRDPLYSLRVPAIGAEGREVRGLGASAAFLAEHLWAEAGLVALAAAGISILARRRSWPLVAGLLALGPGNALFFLAVAARGLVSLDRYLALMDVAVVTAAAIGASAIRIPVLAGIVPPRLAIPAALAVGAAIAVVLSPSIGPLDRGLRARMELERQAAVRWQALLPAFREAVDAMPALRYPPGRRDPTDRIPERPTVLVSAGLLPMAAVDLDLGLDRIARLESFGAAPADLAGGGGSLLYHSPAMSVAADRLTWLEIDAPAELDGVAFVPLASGDEGWLVRVETSP